MHITLQCFGAFRPFGEQLILSVPKQAVVSDLRKALLEKITQLDKHFRDHGLLKSSRFANETEILSESATLQEDMIVTIIPPISGG